jgi:ribosomal-protein-alanine N-acetyltransferase
MDEKPAIGIRPFRKEDMDQILEIERQAFPKSPYPISAFRKYAAEFPNGFMVLERGDKIEGYIIFDDTGHIHSMAVRPGGRRSGAGSTLFRYAFDSVKKGLWLEVRTSNQGAVAFYRSMGMKEIGTIPDYYGDDDALIMVLKK